MKTKIIVFTLIISFFSCENNSNLEIDPENLLIGNWSNAVYGGETITFERVRNLPEEAYGVSFKDEEIFIERSSGFCGTPPLTFFNTEGVWKMSENTLIKVILQSFPGNFNWRIVSLTHEKLVVKRELTEQEIDHRNLMALFDEIYTLSISISCTDSSDWLFTSYGSKACGGPQGYIAYSNQIDVAPFLQLITSYTQAEHEYNIKWGIISTCDVLNQPIGIECQNGFPVLKY